VIQEYGGVLRRFGWIVIVAVMLAGLLSYGISSFQVEMYRATVHVSTVPARPDWGLGNSAKELMRNFVLNLRTFEVAQEVIDRAQLDMHPSEFLRLTDVAVESSTFTIEIEARSRDKIVAEIMALTLADYFADERTAYYAQQDKRDRIEVKIVSREIEAAPYQPQPVVNALAGGVLGFLFGVGLILLLIWIESGFLRTPDSVERTLGLTVLGAIPVSASGSSPGKEVPKGVPSPAASG
jgi:capsular polysaccharide biosynthesis protein